MIDPRTVILLGEELDQLRAENGRLKAELEEVKKAAMCWHMTRQWHHADTIARIEESAKQDSRTERDTMSDGTGCECYASNASECCCDNVDWRSAREIELEVENAQLRKQLAAALVACEAKDKVLESVDDFSATGWLHADAVSALNIKPDASTLRQHDEALIERCAEMCEEYQGSAETCAAAIRELKGKL